MRVLEDWCRFQASSSITLGEVPRLSCRQEPSPSLQAFQQGCREERSPRTPPGERSRREPPVVSPLHDGRCQIDKPLGRAILRHGASRLESHKNLEITAIEFTLRATCRKTWRDGRRTPARWGLRCLADSDYQLLCDGRDTGASVAASGMSMMKTQPLSGILRVWMSPPCALTTFRAIESPRPRPVRSRPRRLPNDRICSRCWSRSRTATTAPRA